MADTDKIHVIAAHNPGFLLTPNSRKVTAISISSKISHFLPVAPAVAHIAAEAILAYENHDFDGMQTTRSPSLLNHIQK